MSLVYRVKENFPGLETDEALEEHKNGFSIYEKNSAICAKIKGKIVGILLFQKENSALCFLAVDSEYRRRHIAQKMVSFMLGFLDSKKDIVVTTYREGVPEGIGARVCLSSMNFKFCGGEQI